MKRIVTAGVALICLSLSSHALAAHPLATDDAGTNGANRYQMETSAEFASDKEDGIKDEWRSIGLAVCGGLTDTLDLSIGVPYSWQTVKNNGATLLDNDGLNDLSVALKWRFLEAGKASFALKPAVTFPTGDYDKGLGAGRPAYSATLISTFTFDPVAIHVNAGYTLQQHKPADKAGSRDNLWNVSLAGAVEVMKRLQLVAEAGAATNGDKSDSTWPTFATGGLIYLARDSLDLSAGVKVGLNAPENDTAILAALTFKFP